MILISRLLARRYACHGRVDGPGRSPVLSLICTCARLDDTPKVYIQVKEPIATEVIVLVE